MKFQKRILFVVITLLLLPQLLLKAQSPAVSLPAGAKKTTVTVYNETGKRVVLKSFKVRYSKSVDGELLKDYQPGALVNEIVEPQKSITIATYRKKIDDTYKLYANLMVDRQLFYFDDFNAINTAIAQEVPSDLIIKIRVKIDPKTQGYLLELQ